MSKINCLILEDEKPAQGVLKKYIAELPYLDLKAVHSNPMSAMEVLQTEKIDLIFLDINLPRISGLKFLKSLKHPPEVIITTAYPDYALEGFELNVADYLLKPISFERFLKAVSSLADPAAPSRSPEDGPRRTEQRERRYTFEKADNTIYKIEYAGIRYIEADRDYVKVNLKDRSYRFRQSLKYWADLLPERHFSRVHKSFIVNIAEISQISGNRIFMGDEAIPIGRNYKDEFLHKIRNSEG